MRKKKEQIMTPAEADLINREKINKLLYENGIADTYEIPEVTPAQERRRRFFDFLKLFLPPVMLLFFLTNVILIGIVPSESMYPALKKNDFLAAGRLSYIRKDVSRGDIVIFKKNGIFYVKRVIGLPGETVSLTDGRVLINGTILYEPYVSELSPTLPLSDGNGLSDFQVPDGFLFVLGDNRDSSADSRYWVNDAGEPAPYINIKNIKGKLLFTVSGASLHTGTHYLYEVMDIDEALLPKLKETGGEMAD